MAAFNRVKNITALLLVTALFFGFCSCKAKSGDETTTAVPDATVTQAEITQADAAAATTQVQNTTQAPQATKAPVTEAQTQAEIITEAPEITGVETITDGNKTIIYPLALKSYDRYYPVISWANGTGCPTQLYTKLLEAIANGGYIVVADSTVMSGNGSAQIDSINYILGKNNDSSSIFYNKVDTAAIGVCGQSQGGRSCINAAQKDSRIRCVVSIAGASNADESRGLAVPCFFITGTNDHVVESSQWCLPSYEAVSGRAAYASLDGGTHLSFANNTNQIADYTLAWFDAYLKNDDSAKAVFYDGGKLVNDSAWQDFRNKN